MNAVFQCYWAQKTNAFKDGQPPLLIRGVELRVRAVTVMALFLMGCFSPFIATSSATSVHNVENFDLVSDTFGAQNSWELTTKKAFSSDTAEYTSAMITDGHLTFDHNRTQNTQTSMLWSSTNSTLDHGSATGEPDNYVAVSSGPEIIVGGFQYSGMESYSIQSMSIVLAFNVPDQLYSDSVRISIEVGGMNTLVKEFSHTQTGLFYMTSPYWSKDISSENYSWQDIGSANVKVDYASVGGTDDSEMRLDSVGFQVVYVAPWFGVETAVAEQTFSAQWPVIEINTSAGTHTDLSLSPCGIEQSSTSIGEWTSEALTRPYDQSWGRLHVTSDGDTSWKVSTSDDGLNWSSATSINIGDILPDSEHIQLIGSIHSGCTSSVRIDINDPSIHFEWQIGESLDGIDSSTSWLEAKVGGEQVYVSILDTLDSYNAVIPIGQHLPIDSNSLEVSFGIVFSWASEGQPSNTVVQIDSMKITGGYNLEWDEDPDCMPIGDVELLEDGVGRLIPILNTCTDDRGANTDLGLSVFQDHTDTVSVDVVGDQIRISQNEEQSGDTIVTAVVNDSAGNYWTHNFVVSVAAVNDPPYFVGTLPQTVIVPLGETYTIPMSFSDPDSTGISVDTSFSWATWNQQEGLIELSPTVVGDFDLQIQISDGNLSAVRNMNVEVMSSADVLVENVSIIGNLSSGSEVEIEVYVRNNGSSDAYFVTVECFADGNLVKLYSIPEIKSGIVEKAICPWMVPMEDDNVLIEIKLDSGSDIYESDEDNNEFSMAVSVEVVSIQAPSPVETSTSVSQIVVWSGTIIALLMILGLFLVFGPAPVKKIK